nr:PIN domain-containing protein [Lachnospiraceae bacterium]
MKIYLDNCCFNRVLDDRSYPVIYLERNSVMLILELAENKRLEIIGSDMLKKEISDTPDYFRRERLSLMYSLCSSEIKVTEAIVDRALEIREHS